MAETELPAAVCRNTSVEPAKNLEMKVVKCVKIARRQLPNVPEEAIVTLAAKIMEMSNEEIDKILTETPENPVFEQNGRKGQEDRKGQKENTDEREMLRNLRCSVKIKH